MSTITWQGIMFGPIHSRRLGTSLGVNLLPSTGKRCSFDCIYCECGWNSDGRTSDPLPSYDSIRSAMEDKLSQLHASGVRIDTITFSGNGEPTIHPDFPRIIDLTLSMRDRFCPDAKVSVLTNSTMLHMAGVRQALMKVDNPILKLDGGDESLIRLMDRPGGGYSMDRTVEWMKEFHGDFILQTMFLKGDIGGRAIDCTSPELCELWRRKVLQLRPREVMMYTIDRETPAVGLTKVSVDEMEDIARPLREAGVRVQIRG